MIHHCCISVRGYLTKKDKDLKTLFRNRETNKNSTAAEAKEFLMQCLSEGKEVIPIGDPCEGFDYKNGCPGHRE